MNTNTNTKFNQLEMVTRMLLPDLKNMSYPERLKILGLTTLESRRLVLITLTGFTETLEWGIVKNYISILLTWMFENFRLAKELLINKGYL